MEFHEQDQPHYILHVRSPTYLRLIGLALLAFNLVPTFYVVVKTGPEWIPSNFLLSLIVLVPTALGSLFALWLVFPTKSSLARFEFTPDYVRFIPTLIARVIGESPEEISLSSQAAEILICQWFAPQKPSTFRIVVRATDGAEHELAGRSPNTRVILNASEIEIMAEVITPATGLPVRMVVRRKSPTGTIEEMPWTESPTKGKLLRAAALAAAALPYVGGIFMGGLSLNPAIVILAGLGLWLCMVFAMYLSSRTGPSPKRFPLLQTLTTLVTFSAAYTACFFFTAYLRGRL